MQVLSGTIVLILYRENIERNYSDELVQLRDHYTEVDKEIIKEFLRAKKSLKTETYVQDQKLDPGIVLKDALINLISNTSPHKPLNLFCKHMQLYGNYKE